MPLLPFYRTSSDHVYFQRATSPSHIDRCSELKQIVALIERLRKKEAELSKAWEAKGAASVDYKKHIIVSDLLKKLDAVIIRFNATNIESSHTAELQNILALVASLTNTVSEVTNDNEKDKILKTPRNSQKDHARTGTDVGLVGSAAAIASVVPMTFPIGLFACAVSAGASTGIKSYAGLNNLDPESYIIVTSLTKELVEVDSNIKFNLNTTALSAPGK